MAARLSQFVDNICEGGALGPVAEANARPDDLHRKKRLAEHAVEQVRRGPLGHVQELGNGPRGERLVAATMKQKQGLKLLVGQDLVVEEVPNFGADPGSVAHRALVGTRLRGACTETSASDDSRFSSVSAMVDSNARAASIC